MTAPSPFRHAPSFHTVEDTGSFVPADFVAQYEALFAEALEAGPIDAGTRARLDQAARALGIESERLARLEQALHAAYEAQAPISKPRIDGSKGSLADADTAGRGVAALVPDVVHELPTKPRTENDELRAQMAGGSLDERVRVAAVLAQRGAATPDECAFYDAHRTRTPPRPLRPLTVEGWDRLLHPDENRTIGRIFSAIASAVLVGRISALRRDGNQPRLDPAERQDPLASTLSATRALAWAAATLGLQIPPMYASPDANVGYRVLCTFPPAVRIGKRMLAGQTATALAFHAARHLSWFRSEHFVCTLVNQIGDLEDIFVAALTIGSPRLELRAEVSTRAALVVNAILPVLEPGQLVSLRELVQGFIGSAASIAELGERANLRKWARAADLSACRAGLLLCGDLATASDVIFPEPNGKERVRELELFWVSNDAAKLRKALGIALR